jgi:hypothetical protein
VRRIAKKEPVMADFLVKMGTYSTAGLELSRQAQWTGTLKDLLPEASHVQLISDSEGDYYRSLTRLYQLPPLSDPVRIPPPPWTDHLKDLTGLPEVYRLRFLNSPVYSGDVVISLEHPQHGRYGVQLAGGENQLTFVRIHVEEQPEACPGVLFLLENRPFFGDRPVGTVVLTEAGLRDLTSRRRAELLRIDALLSQGYPMGEQVRAVVDAQRKTLSELERAVNEVASSEEYARALKARPDMSCGTGS